MSYWTYVNGLVRVHPAGRTQPEIRYVLDTVLEHLPKVTGSERNIHVRVIQYYGHNTSCNCNEFDELQPDSIEMQDEYWLLIEGSLRDRMFENTLREFNKWINRLAKRVWVREIMVRIEGQNKEMFITNAEPYHQMNEPPSWCEESGGEPAWWEYLHWESANGTRYPLLLTYKYYNDPETDSEVERRRKWSDLYK